MRAVVCPRYGSTEILKLEDRPIPQPGKGEVLVKMRAASVNAGDWHLMRGEPRLMRLAVGLFKPKFQVLGMDAAGEVVAVGEGVNFFRPGDAVIGELSEHGFGAFAEYICAPEEALVMKPENLSFEQGAAVPAASVTALQGLRDQGQLQAGQRVLIEGATGGVGTFALQIAKLLGAEVTAVCSTGKVEMACELGADHVIDYTLEDFTQTGQTYDLILGVNAHRSLADYQRCLTPEGRYIMIGGEMKQLWEVMLHGSRKAKKGQVMKNMLVKPNREDLLQVVDWLKTGQISPVIEGVYPLSQVPEAIAYVEAGHARGKVVIQFDAQGGEGSIA